MKADEVVIPRAAAHPRQRKTKSPCLGCFMHHDFCFCELIPKLSLRTKVVLVIHAKELKRTTNTGRLALHALTNSEMRIRGLSKNFESLGDLLTQNYRSLFLSPAEEATELTSSLVSDDPRPIQLIVPDGNWRQANKVYQRQPELWNIPRVKFSDVNIATHHLRNETLPSGMSTLEAIARALGVTEGDHAKEQLLKLYQTKLSRTLKARGVNLGAI